MGEWSNWGVGDSGASVFVVDPFAYFVSDLVGDGAVGTEFLFVLVGHAVHVYEDADLAGGGTLVDDFLDGLGCAFGLGL